MLRDLDRSGLALLLERLRDEARAAATSKGFRRKKRLRAVAADFGPALAVKADNPDPLQPCASTCRQTAVLSAYSTRATLRAGPAPDRTPYEQTVARGEIARVAQFAEPKTFYHSGSSSAEMALQTPPGLRWRLLITEISNSIDELH